MKKNYPYLFLTIVLCLGLTNLPAQIYVDQSAIGSNNGTSWADAYTDLSVALENTTSGDVWIAAGTYLPGQGVPDSSSTFKINGAVNLYGGFDGTETQLSDRDIENNPVILSGDINGDDVSEDFENNKTDNVQHVVVVDSLIASPVIIDGLQVQGGHTSDNNDQDEFFWRGGGIFAYSTIDVSNCAFSENFARSGAGIYVSPNGGGGNGSQFTSCTFDRNRTTSQSAGIFVNMVSDITVTDCAFTNNQTNRGAFYPAECTNVTLNDCAFDNNQAIGSTVFGGAFFIWQSTGVTLDGCTFTNNSAGNAGAIYHDGREASVGVENLILRNCTFSDNAVTDFGGGAMYVFRASMTIDNCTFSDNIGANGSHLFITGDDKEIEITNSTFDGGAAQFGGCAALYGANSNFLVEDCSFSGSIASTSGGALIVGFMADATINNCSFQENSGNFGGAAYLQNDSTFVEFNDCTFTSNSSGTSGAAVYHASGVKNTMNNCEFSLNSSAGSGGAITSFKSITSLVETELELNNSFFNFNSVSEQGAALNIIGVNTDITNCVFINNIVEPLGIGGGAMSLNGIDSTDMIVSLTNSTLANNTAPIGAGISQFTGVNESNLALNIQNSLLFNIGNNYEVESGDPTVVSTGGNLSGDASTVGVLDAATDQNEVLDAFFADISGFNFQLTAESPAIDAGVAAGAPEFDILGNPRIGPVDSGAYEFDPSTSIRPTPVFEEALTILPNPVDKIFRYELNHEFAGKIQMQLINLNGQAIRQWTINKVDPLFQEAINIEQLPQGNYHLVARFGRYISSQSLVKM